MNELVATIAAFKDSIIFIQHLVEAGVSKPYVSVTNEGGIDYYWNTKGLKLDLGLTGDGTYSYCCLFVDGKELIENAAPINAKLPGEIVECLAQQSKHKKLKMPEALETTIEALRDSLEFVDHLRNLGEVNKPDIHIDSGGAVNLCWSKWGVNNHSIVLFQFKGDDHYSYCWYFPHERPLKEGKLIPLHSPLPEEILNYLAA